MSKLYLSIVVPVYNGEGTINKLFKEIKKFCLSKNYLFEVIFVWDCGKDNSWSVIEKLQKENPDIVKGIHLSRNYGQHNALICGFEIIKGDFIITIDEDLQHSPADIEKLIQEQLRTDADVVYGKYETQKHNKFRNVTSNILRFLIHIGIPELYNNYSAFRLIKAPIGKACINMHNSYTFLDGYLSWVTGNFSSCIVSHHKRLAGKSSYTFQKLLYHSVNIFFTFSSLPLKFVNWMSFSFFLFTLIYSFYIFLEKLLFNSLIPGYASTIIMLGVGFGTILFSLSIIGQYIHRINLKTTKKPNYLIKKTI